MPIELPKKTVNQLVEHKGVYEDVEVEDRPTKLVKHQFNEHKGIYEDIEVPLTDEEIYQAAIANATAPAKPKADKPPAKKKAAKKKAKKKVSKKK